MRVLALILLAYTQLAVAESIYVVQSHVITDLYGDEIVREIKRKKPNASVSVLFVRNFDADKYPESKQIAEDWVRQKSSSHDNLVLLGNDIGYFESNGKRPAYLPVVSYDEQFATRTVASTRTVVEKTQRLYKMLGLKGNIYVVCDHTELSRRRFEQIKIDMKASGAKDAVPIVVDTPGSLRSELLRLNSNPKGILINNAFVLNDVDGMPTVGTHQIDVTIAKNNTTHVDVGVLRERMVLTVGIGALPKDIASMAVSLLDNDRVATMETAVGVNLNRAAALGVEKALIDEPATFDYVEVNGPVWAIKP